MKKTININLCNRVFQIEEDAYNMLEQYLDSIRRHFRRTDPDGEIVDDIEARISELFAEKKAEGYDVITTKIASEVIQRIGDTGELDDDASADDGEAHEETPGESASGERKSRKFYRDISRKWVAGVLAGLGAYTDVAPWILRVCFLILLFTPINVALIIIYIACALFINPARTVNDRLEMEGEMVSPNAIWRKISEESVELKDKVTSQVNSFDRKMGFTRSSQEREQGEKKSGSWNWLWWVLGALILVILGLGMAFLWAPDAVLGLQQGLSDGFYGNDPYAITEALDNLSSVFGVALIFIIPIVIIFVLVLLALTLALLIVPIGLILRSTLTPVAKLFLILVWFVLFFTVLW